MAAVSPTSTAPLRAGQGDLTDSGRAGLPVRPRPAASCQPDRVEERHPLRRDQDRPLQAQDARLLACIPTRILSVPFKGSLRRAKRAPLTAPGRSEAHNLYEGKGIRGTSHLSTISASAPQSAFHRSTVLKCGRLLARSWARCHPLETRKSPIRERMAPASCIRHKPTTPLDNRRR